MPTHNRDKVVIESLRKLSRLDHYLEDQYEIVVYNNFSTDNTHQAIEEARTYFKNPETIQSFSRPYEGSERGGWIAASFLTRGKYNSFLADDDYYDIEKFATNVLNLKDDNSSLLSWQVGVKNKKKTEWFINAHIKKDDVNSFFETFFMNGYFDFFENAIYPADAAYFPGFVEFQVFTYLQGLRSLMLGDIYTVPTNHYHRVDDQVNLDINNKERLSDYSSVLSIDNHTPAAEIYFSYLNKKFKNKIPILKKVIEIGSYSPINRMLAGYFRAHTPNFIEQKRFINASHCERRANLYFPEDSIVCDFFLLFICAEVFLKWFQQLFFIKQIVIPYQSLADFKEFFQACGFIKPNCLNAFSVSNFYDFNQQSHRDMAFIVLTLEEKKKIAAEGFTYPGLIFAIEEIHDFYKIAPEPFNWNLMKENAITFFKSNVNNAA